MSDTESESGMDFESKISQFVARGGGEALLWAAMRDLGKQVASIRHAQKNSEQGVHTLNAQLFGFPNDPHDGGKFGKIEADISTLRQTTVTVTQAQTEELKRQLRLYAKVGGAALGMVPVLIAGIDLISSLGTHH